MTGAGDRMPLTEGDLEILACPRCRGSIEAAGGALVCSRCTATYPIRAGVPDLVPWAGGEPGPEWARWRERLDRLEEWRRATWDGSDRATERQRIADVLAESFFRFARVPERGPVLEIGCGDAGLSRYLPRRRYWGLDPLAGETAVASDAVALIRGVGETLPFAGEAFESVLICETLDHSLDPARVLGEAKRVLRENGVLAVMQSVRLTVPPPPIRVRLRAAAGRLKARLAGRRRIDDADTKMHVMDQDDLADLVNAAFTTESGITEGPVMFLRALKQDPQGPRVPKRNV